MDEMKSISSALETAHSRREVGFTLVELMIVVAIVAILAAIATPAYINYINRVKQSEAASLLLTAKLEMEEFYADNNRYAEMIGCLPSFTSSDSTEKEDCLADCRNCTTDASRAKWYTFYVANVGANYFRIAATRAIYSSYDLLYISSTRQTPYVPNAGSPDYVLKFSVYNWLFGN